MKQHDKPDKKAKAAKSPPQQDANVQGEGDYAADRRYRERTDRFLETADVDKVAHAAAPKSPEEAKEMAQAEAEGRSHAHLPPGREGRPGK